MYRQILHTECKPGLRLSRGYEGTEAQRKVKHMPWWEQGVETTKRMVISYNNLIVRLWLNGAIMPYVDGGYASEHVDVTVLKDDMDAHPHVHVAVPRELEEGTNNHHPTTDAKKKEGDDDHENNHNDTNTEKNETDHENISSSSSSTHINTLIDSNGLPPIPHPYWVDRLGFQQTDPVTDFRSGGVLSLAMLVHIVEACPNVHARFLPSGDAHMLPFGITCINITDMLAKFCMFSKAVDRMDALLSQKPFWRMFADPNSLLVLQELSMEVLCNVVVEMGRERKMPKVKSEQKDTLSFQGQDDTDKVTVFDFAEILAKTEKRVHDDLLGSGPKSVDELRAIHTRNFTKYMKALERKEQQAQKQYDRVMQRKKAEDLKSLAVNRAAEQAISGIHSSSSGDKKSYPDDEFLVSVEEAKKATKVVADNVFETAGGMLNKFKQFSFRSSNYDGDGTATTTTEEKDNEITTEEINFAVPKSPNSSVKEMEELSNKKPNEKKKDDLFDMSDAPAPPVFEKTTDISVDDLFDFDETAAPASNFTIDDDDFI